MSFFIITHIVDQDGATPNNKTTTSASGNFLVQSQMIKDLSNEKLIRPFHPFLTNTSNRKPSYLKYHHISIHKTQAYLNVKNSLLHEDQYLTPLLATGKELDIGPLLLIAIIGQEQGFVDKRHQKASIIINNPFNVYGSWVAYNTNIADSTNLAANLINKRLSICPANADPFQWINHQYAEDENWWRGVKTIYKTLSNEIR